MQAPTLLKKPAVNQYFLLSLLFGFLQPAPEIPRPVLNIHEPYITPFYQKQTSSDYVIPAEAGIQRQKP
jgi:hypothetical protein